MPEHLPDLADSWECWIPHSFPYQLLHVVFWLTSAFTGHLFLFPFLFLFLPSFVQTPLQFLNFLLSIALRRLVELYFCSVVSCFGSLLLLSQSFLFHLGFLLQAQYGKDKLEKVSIRSSLFLRRASFSKSLKEMQHVTGSLPRSYAGEVCLTTSSGLHLNLTVIRSRVAWTQGLSAKCHRTSEPAISEVILSPPADKSLGVF